jgi:hypothetical protein
MVYLNRNNAQINRHNPTMSIDLFVSQYQGVVSSGWDPTRLAAQITRIAEIDTDFVIAMESRRPRYDAASDRAAFDNLFSEFPAIADESLLRKLAKAKEPVDIRGKRYWSLSVEATNAEVIRTCKYTMAACVRYFEQYGTDLTKLFGTTTVESLLSIYS